MAGRFVRGAMVADATWISASLLAAQHAADEAESVNPQSGEQAFYGKGTNGGRPPWRTR